jgi:hypothetical protein
MSSAPLTEISSGGHPALPLGALPTGLPGIEFMTVGADGKAEGHNSSKV